ncbi:PLC-A protein [Lepidopterella palustris CBS 459.81]|uniref:PLC-A protein n=1 Tax=Lepidopterella palustris CBS 459.81 TaxID=1314670 RepID=A0A8E2E3D1_9PEZI|nr:PLC-A protein [Lepidopterella palustris CBS 459.81]
MPSLAFIITTLVTLASASPVWNSDGDDSWRSRIKNVVVLVEENRSFDTIAGGLTYNTNIDGLLHRKYCNPANVSMPNGATVCAQPTAQNIAPDDPNHGISGVNMEIFSTYHPDEANADAGKLQENMMGFVTEQSSTYKTQNLTRAAEAINYYAEYHVRVFASMAENFVLFDRWFAAVPGPTNPNRAYLTSGTSHGHGRNDAAFNVAALPQRSIFQQLSEKNVSWINYYNSSFAPDSLFYSWTVSSGKNATNVKPLSQFYADAKAGTLPQFTYINPECCSYDSFHPPSPITLGENFIKSIYEALRSSPQWDSTLFILTFDEHGGFGDHVAPPVNVPAGDSLTYTETAPDGKNITFDFKRLGIRVPTLVISPWVEGGKIEKKGRNQGGEYSHTSILAFLAKLWDLDVLTPRVGWSASFEHLITDYFRSDTPEKLPNPYPF